MKRGDVWWLEDPDLGRRPVCVVTRDQAIPVLRAITVALATRRARGIETEVVLDRTDGMPTDCVVALDNLRVVRKANLTERITRLSDVRMHEVCTALNRALGCA